MTTFQTKISKLPDLERNVSRIYNSLQASRLNSRSHDSFSNKRANELQALLQQMQKLEEIMSIFEDYIDGFKSQRLKNLCSYKQDQEKSAQKSPIQSNEKQEYKSYIQTINNKKKKEQTNGLFPRLNTAINNLLEMVEIDQQGIITPKQGECEQYEEGDRQLKKYQQMLKKELEKWQKNLECKEIKFIDFKNQRCQLQVPDKVWNDKIKVPNEFILISKSKDTRRFYTPLIEDTIQKIIEQERQNAEYILPFLEEYIRKFHSNKDIWYQAISCLKELDCYCSLASCCLDMNKAVCKPKFVKDRCFELKGMYHPCMVKAGFKMEPNDTFFDKGVNCLLVTGPNMAGKSTLLRQTCIAVILAQLGCFIPADSFKLQIVDRIFCRIGASDKPIEGKSTFYVEMEETSVIVNECSENSLVMFDELGRGTSTYDGVSIACGVLQYLANNKGCWTLFATHYQFLLDEFRLYSNIRFYLMQYECDVQNKQIKFLYKFVEGETVKSFATNVARIAGIPEEVINIAEQKEKQINTESEKLGQLISKTQIFNKTIQSLLISDVDQLIKSIEQLDIE